MPVALPVGEVWCIMIIYDLRCAKTHQFEGWFESGEECEQQLAGGRIACPICNDTRIERVLSPVAIKKKVPPRQDHESVRQVLRNLCRYVHDNFEDVGHNFAKEALKVHCGLTEERNIRGVTTEAEEEMLKEEGVPFVKIPMPQQLDS